MYYRHRSSIEGEFGGSHEDYLELLRGLCPALERDGAEVYLIDFDVEQYRHWHQGAHAGEPDTGELRTEWAFNQVQDRKMRGEEIVPWRERLGLTGRPRSLSTVRGSRDHSHSSASKT